MKKRKTEKMVIIALLSAFSYVLLFLEIPIMLGLGFSWLKLDFSDIPVLFGAFITGPVGGIAVALIRSSLNFLLKGGDLLALIGNATGFMASVVFMLPIYFMAKKDNSNKNIIKGCLLSSISLIIFMSVANYYVITPLYIKVFGMNFGMPVSKMVLYGVIPFNIIKSIAVSLVFFVTYKKLMPSIEKKFDFGITKK